MKNNSNIGNGVEKGTKNPSSLGNYNQKGGAQTPTFRKPVPPPPPSPKK